MPIDYSKWDNLEEYSSSNSGDDNEEESNHLPRVTRLDAPSKVTFGGSSASATIQPSSSVPTIPATSSSAVANQATLESKHQKLNQQQQEEQWTAKGGTVVVNSNEQERKLYWCQDRYSVSLRLQLCPAEKVKSVTAEGIVKFEDRHAAISTTKPRLQCRGYKSGKGNENNNLVLLNGELPHPVHLAEDEEDIDWSVVTTTAVDSSSSSPSERYLLITLYKAVPMQGVFIWWRRPLMQFPEIEMDKNTNDHQQQQFRDAWEEAHKLFREKRKNENLPC